MGGDDGKRLGSYFADGRLVIRRLGHHRASHREYPCGGSDGLFDPCRRPVKNFITHNRRSRRAANQICAVAHLVECIVVGKGLQDIPKRPAFHTAVSVLSWSAKAEHDPEVVLSIASRI